MRRDQLAVRHPVALLVERVFQIGINADRASDHAVGLHNLESVFARGKRVEILRVEDEFAQEEEGEARDLTRFAIQPQTARDE